MTAPATEPPVVVRDVFPARVVIGDAVYGTARVVITRDRLLVYVDRTGPVLDEPYLPEQSTVPPYNAPPARAAHVALADGREVAVVRQRGCACTSPLKSWRPWAPYRVAASA